jgi:tetratricopeptide (TPR) repeat protein
MGLLSKFFGGKDTGVQSEEDIERAQKTADAVADQLLQIALGKNPGVVVYNGRSKAAMGLMTQSDYARAKLAWESLIEDCPEHLAYSLKFLGMNYQLQCNYRAALDTYDRAIKAGLDPSVVANSIQTARAGLEIDRQTNASKNTNRH